MCCLGVLCDISGKGKWVNHGKGLPMVYQLETPSLVKDCGGTLNEDMLDWSGLNYAQQDELIKLNDGNKTWDKVIEYIKENL